MSASATAASSGWSSAPEGGVDVAVTLERLASLHRRKELADAEYEAAKRKALGETGSGT